ncbi:MAG: hypothetical protein GF329_00995 [Candidatus Lokiarchaeota archaeon]|nr:hypothetical protein [Candidatus Lokiarchaeota archaeon]
MPTFPIVHFSLFYFIKFIKTQTFKYTRLVTAVCICVGQSPERESRHSRMTSLHSKQTNGWTGDRQFIRSRPRERNKKLSFGISEGHGLCVN